MIDNLAIDIKRLKVSFSMEFVVDSGIENGAQDLKEEL